MTSKEQLVEWIKGNSLHNGKERKDGECCPDFSCCIPELKWPKEKREKFASATEEEQVQMLAGALHAAMDYHEIRKVGVIS